MSFILYTKYYMHKSVAFSAVIAFYNTTNGFSSFHHFDDLFYALFKVAVTVVAVYFFLLYDQQVSFKYTGKEDQLNFKLSKLFRQTQI